MPVKQTRPAPASVREDIRCVPTEHVELAACGKEVEARLRQRKPPLALQQRFQPRPKGMQMQHVRRRIGELLRGQVPCPPIRCLLLLR